MKDRTRARGIALQALGLGDELVEFFRSIVLGVLPIRSELDHFIADHAPDWPLDQVAVIDRNILRIALWEFAIADDIPLKVAINEAVELAKAYGSDSAPRFVNGVLGSLAERQHEIIHAFQQIQSREAK